MSRPRNVKLDEEKGNIIISWMDGTTTHHSMSQLRKKCPCANCNIERQKIEAPGPVLRVISSDTPPVQVAKIVEFSPVGRYALAFVFNDGHSTGIFTYDFLKENTV